jgi:hypothetical protein
MLNQAQKYADLLLLEQQFSRDVPVCRSQGTHALGF